jgi:glycosyltransferase involved in cell wall biosynthesis
VLLAGKGGFVRADASQINYARTTSSAVRQRARTRYDIGVTWRTRYPLPVTLSVVIITHNEEANIGRTLESVKTLVCDGKGEVIVVDSGSTDRTLEIAKSFGAKVFVEEWKGYAAQKNLGIAKATGDWILSLDADEEVDGELVEWIGHLLLGRQRASVKDGVPRNPIAVVATTISGFSLRRKNYFLGRWIKHGGFWPDPKPRLFRRGSGKVPDAPVHESIEVEGGTRQFGAGALIHHSYPTLSDYIDHMNRYSSLGAEMAAGKGHRGFNVINIVVRPLATFIYNYFFRLGFLDGREGLLLHLYHAVYVSWKYAKAWELARKADSSSLRSSE